jgi:hypothetical protein
MNSGVVLMRLKLAPAGRGSNGATMPCAFRACIDQH